MENASPNRALTAAEKRLVGWMLRQSTASNVADLLVQLERASVTPWRCRCGCGSLQFQIAGKPKPAPGMLPLATFWFGPADAPSGLFVYECAGVLSGVEVYGTVNDAPHVLPMPEELRAA